MDPTFFGKDTRVSGLKWRFFSVVTHEKLRDFNPATGVDYECGVINTVSSGCDRKPEIGFARGRAESFALKNHVYSWV